MDQLQEAEMKCIICHSPNVELRKVEEEIRNNNDVILVPIETLMCLECGEKYYDRKTMKYFEKMKNKVKKHKAELNTVGHVLKAVVA